MKEGPPIAALGALLGDPGRANIVTALLAGPALTAGELAREAGVSAQAASGHLARLQAAGLLQSMPQGRHRYYALASPDVAELLEQILGLAAKLGAVRTRPGPKDPGLRRARVCYDHLAGEVAVELFDRLLRQGAIAQAGARFELTVSGRHTLQDLGVNLQQDGRRREICRGCLDWSERRPHLAGLAGARLLQRFAELDYLRRVQGSRRVELTPAGDASLATLFQI